MRHKIAYRKLNRTSSHRSAMMVNMACSLILHEQISTTLPKAKEIRPYFEKLVTLAKKTSNVSDLVKIRRKSLLLSKLKNNKVAVEKLISVLSSRYLERNGGYVRIIKAGFRKGDAAPVAYIQLVDGNA